MNNEFKALHMRLQDLLAGYADNMLSEQETGLVEAHLVGCEACRNDLARQQILTQHLNNRPVTRMSVACHQQIDEVLSEADAAANPAAGATQKHSGFLNFNWRQKNQGQNLFASSGWGVAVLLLLVILIPKLDSVENKPIPMVQDVLAEYHQLSQMALPVATQNSPITLPASWPSAHALASWKTTVGGAPAEAFAIRSGNNIVLQFLIDDSVLFNNPDVRLAMAEAGQYLTNQRGLDVLAMPLKNAGLLMVAPKGGLPIKERLVLQSI